MNKTITIVIVVLLFLGAVIYFMSSGNDTSEVTPVQNTQTDSSSVIDSDGGNGTGAPSDRTVNSVVLAPTKTGNNVVVESATLNAPGYVVIYRVNSNSETEVMGNSDLLLPGTYNNMTIQLDSIIALEQTIVATLHADDGDGVFEFPESDFYLGDSTQTIVSDVDVVDVSSEKEDVLLQEQVELYLEKNVQSSN